MIQRSTTEPEVRWYACWTRSRAEKRVKAWLDTHRIEAFLPLVEKERQWADRKKRVPFPLFPGYLFVRVAAERVPEVVRAPSVVTIVGTEGRPSPIRGREIASVRALLEGVNRSGILPSPADFLEDGDWVRVIDGPFEGMEGILLEGAGRPRVVVQLSAIHQAVRVELERAVLRPA